MFGGLRVQVEVEKIAGVQVHQKCGVAAVNFVEHEFGIPLEKVVGEEDFAKRRGAFGNAHGVMLGKERLFVEDVTVIGMAEFVCEGSDAAEVFAESKQDKIHF